MPKKILLADDSITIQKVISITFAGEDYDMVVVGDGDTAVAKIKEVKPDVVLADVAMPGKNGYEVCDVIKKDPSLQHIPVLLLAGTFEPLNEKEAQRVRSDDYIVKPFESQELIDKVKNLLSKPPAPLQAPAVEVERPPVPEVKEPAPSDIWEVGDFMGTEEAETQIKAAPEAEQDIWGAEFFEEPSSATPSKPEEPAKVEEEFIDLELKEEELQPIEEVKPAPSPPEPEERVEAPSAAQPDLEPPSAPTPPAPEEIASKMAGEAEERISSRVAEVSGVPRDKLEEIIKDISREVIAEIAWEVIPDLAEELIKEEIRKVREVIGKTK